MWVPKQRHFILLRFLLALEVLSCKRILWSFPQGTLPHHIQRWQSGTLNVGLWTLSPVFFLLYHRGLQFCYTSALFNFITLKYIKKLKLEIIRLKIIKYQKCKLNVIKDYISVNQCFGCVREFLKGLTYKFRFLEILFALSLKIVLNKDKHQPSP